MNKYLKITGAALIAILIFAFADKEKSKTSLTPKEEIGKLIFNDDNLSEPRGQSCATCHDSRKGFADKDSRVVSEGAVKGLFSQRNSMTVCYTMYVPPLHWNAEDETYVGGLFWDGRVDSLAAQAAEPFVNPVEMGMTKELVVERVKQADYYPDFVKIYGNSNDVNIVYANITNALAAYQSSSEINPYTSKFDAYLDGKYEFTAQERRGLELFVDIKKGMCAECHIVDKEIVNGKKDLTIENKIFTDHTYDNLGIPKNPQNPHYGVPAKYNLLSVDGLDLGLGPIVKKDAENGKFRVPTLRNIELTAPYGHNGYFKTLEDIVHFYNVRDVEPRQYPQAEYPATINKDEMGNLGLTAQDEADIVAFLKTLTDGYFKR